MYILHVDEADAKRERDTWAYHHLVKRKERHVGTASTVKAGGGGAGGEFGGNCGIRLGVRTWLIVPAEK